MSDKYSRSSHGHDLYADDACTREDHDVRRRAKELRILHAPALQPWVILNVHHTPHNFHNRNVARDLRCMN